MNLSNGPEGGLFRPQVHPHRRQLVAATRLLLRGQINFVRMLWKFNSVYHPELQLNDHRQPVKYEMRLPAPSPTGEGRARDLFILRPDPVKQPAPAH